MDIAGLRHDLERRDAELETLTKRHERLERAFRRLIEGVGTNPLSSAEVAHATLNESLE